FWEIAIPLVAVVIPVFMWSDLKRVVHYAEKRWAARRLLMVRPIGYCVVWLCDRIDDGTLVSVNPPA
ncbi:hypothetical protein M405DRAFT_808025, partial [Rhizopogon salebrosus TDB-379]